jgi:hypothetical protein
MVYVAYLWEGNSNVGQIWTSIDKTGHVYVEVLLHSVQNVEPENFTNYNFSNY